MLLLAMLLVMTPLTRSLARVDLVVVVVVVVAGAVTREAVAEVGVVAVTSTTFNARLSNCKPS
jgi:hypothetical protein